MQYWVRAVRARCSTACLDLVVLRDCSVDWQCIVCVQSMKMDIIKTANKRDQLSYAQKKTDQGFAIIQVSKSAR